MFSHDVFFAYHDLVDSFYVCRRGIPPYSGPTYKSRSPVREFMWLSVPWLAASSPFITASGTLSRSTSTLCYSPWHDRYGRPTDFFGSASPNVRCCRKHVPLSGSLQPRTLPEKSLQSRTLHSGSLQSRRTALRIAAVTPLLLGSGTSVTALRIAAVTHTALRIAPVTHTTGRITAVAYQDWYSAVSFVVRADGR